MQPTASSKRRTSLPGRRRPPRPEQHQPESAPALPAALLPPAVVADMPDAPPTTRPLGPFSRGSLLGQGSFAKVWTGLHRPTGREVAIKSYDRKKVQRDPKLRRLLKQESTVLALVDHPNVLRLYQAITTSQSVHLVTELVRGGSLRGLVRRRGALGEGFSRAIFAQLLGAVGYLHELGIVHRDIKLENVLLKGGVEVKLVDFGFSALDRDDGSYRLTCGTPLYMAPEILNKHPYGKEVDVWALGVTLYAMVFGAFPFSAIDTTDLQRVVNKGSFALPPTCSKALRQLLRGMLNPDPAARLTVGEAAEHAWMVQGSTLPVRPARARIGCAADVDEGLLERALEVDSERTQAELVAALVRNERSAATVTYGLLST